jgi:protein-S-isoprenylcysteine O-methyltransferase Ste14
MRTWLIRFALFVLSIAVYLGIAIAGAGGWEAYFSNPARLALAIVTMVLSAAAVFSGGNLSTGVREDRGNRWVLAVFTVIGLLMMYVPAYTDWMNIWTVDGEALRWTGVVLYTAGCVLRLWPVFVLGHRFSELVAIQPDHQLVTSGIYRHVRNPSYLGLLIGSLGWALAFRSLAGVLLTALLIPPLVARMRSEERLLSSEFGAEYDDYRARTPRLIPRI